MEVTLKSKFNTISELSRLKLANILTGISGLKDLIIEQTILRSMDKICGAKWLKLYDVEKIYKLEDNLLLQSPQTQVFMIPSNLLQLKRITNILESVNCIDLKSEPPRVIKYHVIVVPKILNVFEDLLEETGFYGFIQLHSFMWQFMYVDKSVISLELPNIFNEIYVEKDLSLLPSISKSLYYLFDIVGKPKVTIPVGKHSHDVLEHIKIFEDHMGCSDKINSDFGAIIIMDRPVDFISALLTNVTYTGLLTEIYRINGGVVEVIFPESNADSEPSTSTESEKKSKPVFTIDNKNDSIYSEIKHRHISEVSDMLGNHARQLKIESKVSHEMELSEIKTYVQTKLQSVTAKSKYLSFHLQACEKIITSLGIKFERLQCTERSCLENVNKSENLINIQDYIITENQFRSLRLFCLMSLTQRLSWDEFNSLKLQYLHEHGYKLLYVFQNLINCGLMLQPQSKLSALSLPSIGQKKDFYSIANKLKLIPPKPELLNVRSPTCPSYVSGGNYIPLIVQLLTMIIQAKNVSDVQSKLELIGGSIITENSDKPFPLERRIILVFIIGGVTYAEIAACNLIEKLCGCTIVLASNCLISGNDLVNQCI